MKKWKTAVLIATESPVQEARISVSKKGCMWNFLLNILPIFFPAQRHNEIGRIKQNKTKQNYREGGGAWVA